MMDVLQSLSLALRVDRSNTYPCLYSSVNSEVQHATSLQALGVKDAARALGSVENAKQNKQPAKRKRAQSALAPREKRASERTKNVVINYNEDQNDHLLKGLPR